MNAAHEGFTPIAVIGMAGRFPRSPDIERFWAHCMAGDDCVTRWGTGTGEDGRVRASGLLEDVDAFDAELFGVSSAEAELLDPQHRVFLELAWQALESAAVAPGTEEAVSVYAAAAPSRYQPAMSGGGSENERYQRMIANSTDFLATRVAYLLDLHGEAISVQTGCSSSLVAVHLAAQSLCSGLTDVALAGGISLDPDQHSGYVYQEGMIASPDGRCLPFDARSNGTVPANGAGVVVLQRLEDALAQGRPVHAVIRATAANNDGRVKSSFMAPAVRGQSEVIATALALADLEADSIGYYEAHGTGTRLGDPIEIEAARRAYELFTERTGFAALGSLKANFGHLDRAAGVAGLIKAVCAVRDGIRPPLAGFHEPNPDLQLESSPFRVPLTAEPWPEANRRAAVSSFGVGGTNAHAIVERYRPEAAAPAPADGAALVLPVSAHSTGALARRTEALAGLLSGAEAPALGPVAHTLAAGRGVHAARTAVVARTAEEAAALLRGAPEGRQSDGDRTDGPVVLTFPGQAGRGDTEVRGIYDRFPEFRAEIDACAAALGLPGTELLSGLTGPVPADAGAPTTGNPYQPTLVAVEIAHARLLAATGVQVAAVTGSSLGEFAAAYQAGIFDRDGLMHLLHERDRLMRATPEGAMTAVACSAGAVGALLGPELSLAGENAPDRVVLAGTPEAVERAEAALAAAGHRCRRLPGAIAFHSPLMESVTGPFREAVRQAAPRVPRLPVVSAVTGRWLSPEEAVDPEYWVRHLREPIRLVGAFGTLLGAGHLRFVEAGPGTALTGLLRRNGAGVQPLGVSVSGSDGAGGFSGLATALAALWEDGVTIDWDAVNGTAKQVLAAIPGHVFDRRARYWNHRPDAVGPGSPADRRPVSLDIPEWRVSPRAGAIGGLPSRVALLTRGGALADAVAGLLAEAGTTLVAGHGTEPADAVVDLRWAETGAVPERALLEDADVDAWLAEGLWNPARDLLSHRPLPATYLVVTRGLSTVLPDEEPCTGAAAALGLVRCLPHEFPGMRAHLVDLGGGGAAAAEAVLAELAMPDPRDVAYRDGIRFTTHHRTAPLQERTAVKEGGTYLVLGGTGRLGAVVADALSREAPVTLLLAGRDPERPLGAAQQAMVDAARRRGCTVRNVRLDVTSEQELRSVLAEAEREFGAVDGFFHLAGHTDTEDFPLLEQALEAPSSDVAAAKVRGAAVLAAVLRERPCSFVVLFSSISTVLGGLGFGPYVSANAFLDALAVRETARTGVPWTSVCWDGWSANLQPADGALDGVEGSRLLRRALRTPAPLVVAAVTDTETRRAGVLAGLARVAREAAVSSAGGGGVGEPGQVLGTVLKIVEQVLGDAPGDPDRSLRMLGADSLQMMQIAAQLQASLGVEVPLAALLRARSVRELETVCAGARRPAENAVPAGSADVGGALASVQQRLWYLWQLDPREVNYNVPFGWEFPGVAPERAAAGLRALLERHAGLRTAYEVDATGTPRRRITGTGDVDIELVELTAADGPDLDSEFLTHTEAFIGRPFDLTRASVRVLVAGSGKDPGARSSRVLMVCHHIAIDAWSVELIRRDLEQLLAPRGAVELPEPPASYDAFVVAEQRFRESPAYERQVAYWTEATRGVEPVAPPEDASAEPDGPRTAGEARGALSPDVLASLRALAAQADTTLYTLALTALSVALGEWCGREEVVIGTNLANRSLPGLDSVVGMFVDPVMLRVRPRPETGDGTLGDSLAGVRDTFLAALDHSELPYQDVVRLSGLGGRGAENPLFSVIATMFDGQSGPRPDGAPEMRALRLPRQSRVKFRLSVEFLPGPDGLELQVLYPTEHYLPATVQRFADRVTGLLEGLARDGLSAVAAPPLPAAATTARRRFSDRFARTAPATAADTRPHALPTESDNR
ncbi:SDR family NAD(P)-dependent oxidoreductase [Streptomyces sp. NBC_00239]|uniref:SDR family NAD(P)-dependent oxidoreductase n=1 Tax=Streptomyces sp. NBC_00239 TaxID=2903640 RepID=UPI002E2BE245|nr:SDR family NAD(P)-dependent oxidoreductase [Streptomyces sp. NBC_00239]